MAHHAWAGLAEAHGEPMCMHPPATTPGFTRFCPRCTPAPGAAADITPVSSSWLFVEPAPPGGSAARGGGGSGSAARGGGGSGPGSVVAISSESCAASDDSDGAAGGGSRDARPEYGSDGAAGDGSLAAHSSDARSEYGSLSTHSSDAMSDTSISISSDSDAASSPRVRAARPSACICARACCSFRGMDVPMVRAAHTLTLLARTRRRTRSPRLRAQTVVPGFSGPRLRAQPAQPVVPRAQPAQTVVPGFSGPRLRAQPAQTVFPGFSPPRLRAQPAQTVFPGFYSSHHPDSSETPYEAAWPEQQQAIERRYGPGTAWQRLELLQDVFGHYGMHRVEAAPSPLCPPPAPGAPCHQGLFPAGHSRLREGYPVAVLWLQGAGQGTVRSTPGTVLSGGRHYPYTYTDLTLGGLANTHMRDTDPPNNCFMHEVTVHVQGAPRKMWLVVTAAAVRYGQQRDELLVDYEGLFNSHCEPPLRKQPADRH